MHKRLITSAPVAPQSTISLWLMVLAMFTVVAAGACSYLRNLNCADVATLGTTAPMLMQFSPAAPMAPIMPTLGALYAENFCKAVVSVSDTAATPTPLPSPVATIALPSPAAKPGP